MHFITSKAKTTQNYPDYKVHQSTTDKFVYLNIFILELDMSLLPVGLKLYDSTSLFSKGFTQYLINGMQFKGTVYEILYGLRHLEVRL